MYQALSAQAAAIHEMFVHTLSISAGSYAATEAANAIATTWQLLAVTESKMMDFAALCPEINSALMYSGPGSAPMMAAASAWKGLAAELDSAAVSYDSVVSALAGDQWRGPASESMAAAAKSFVTWMSTAAVQAEKSAAQAEMAAGAFEIAFAATVNPAAIAANRAQLMALIATNFLGQNTPAIAATEAHYLEMWAQMPRRCMPTPPPRRPRPC